MNSPDLPIWTKLYISVYILLWMFWYWVHWFLNSLFLFQTITTFTTLKIKFFGVAEILFCSVRVQILCLMLHGNNKIIFTFFRFSLQMFQMTAANVIKQIVWGCYTIEFFTYCPVAFPHKMCRCFRLPVSCKNALLVASNSKVSCGINSKFKRCNLVYISPFSIWLEITHII
jgi:hypothetical protein